jgi:poly(A) polymerase Pap1
MFEQLFVKTDFFIDYAHYLALVICAPTASDLQSWTGFIESRLRKLISDLMGKSLPLSKIQLWPKKFDGCFADKTSGLTAAQRQHSCAYVQASGEARAFAPPPAHLPFPLRLLSLARPSSPRLLPCLFSSR